MKRQYGEQGDFADLPVLEELGETLVLAFRAEEELEARAARLRKRRHRPLARRMVVIAAIFVLLVPSSVVALRPWWAPIPDQNSPRRGLDLTPEVRLASGKNLSWVLSARQSTRGFCYNLWVGREQTGSCAHTLRAGDALHVAVFGVHDGRSFVFGLTRSDVSRVRLKVGDKQMTLPTLPPKQDDLPEARPTLPVRYFIWSTKQDLDLTYQVRGIAYNQRDEVVGHYPPRR